MKVLSHREQQIQARFFTDFETDPIMAVRRMCKAIGLKPGVDTGIVLRRGSTAHRGVELDIDMKLLDPRVRRKLKRLVDLEVPSWAMRYKEPTIQGHWTQRNENREIAAEFQVNGAFVCEQKGTRYEPAPEYAIKEAAKLEAMTAEQALEYVKKIAAEQSAGREVPNYVCKSSV